MEAIWLLKFLISFHSIVFVSGQFENAVPFEQDIIVEDEIVQEKWTLVETQIKHFVKGVVKMLLPSAIEASSSLNISSDCVRDTLTVIRGFQQMKSWAFAFLDATSKPLSGILSGNINSLGDFDQCIDINVTDEMLGGHERRPIFTGNYCTLRFRFYLPHKPKRLFPVNRLRALNNFTSKDTLIGSLAKYAHMTYNVPISIAICVPSSCSEGDINQVLKKASDYIGMSVKTDGCQIKGETPLTSLMIGALAFYSILVAFGLLGSVIDVYCRYSKKEFRSTGFRILMSFSFVSNSQKLMNTSTSSGNLSCLNGIKCISMFWIILGHTYAASSFAAYKLGNTITRAYDFAFQIIVNGSYCSNTFFFISGTLLSYYFVKTFKIEKKQFNLTIYVLHRIWRFLPALAFTFAFYVLLPQMGSGPEYRRYINKIYEHCHENWWAKILFVTNFYDSRSQCVTQSWYLSLDMQFYNFSLIILLPLIRWPKFGLSIAAVAIVAGIIGSWVTKHVHGLSAYFFFLDDFSRTNDLFVHFYALPQAHVSSYCIGLLCGYLLLTYPNLRIPIVMQVLGWSASCAIVVLLFKATQKWGVGVEPTFLEKVFYTSLNRTAWAMAVAWVTVCCCTGHGGVVNYVLSWKIWAPIGRLALMAYLIHPALLASFFASAKTEFRVDDRVLMWISCGTFVVTFFVAFWGSMLVEAPFLQLEKVLLSPKRNQESPSLKKENNETLQGPVVSGKELVIALNDKERTVGEEVIGAKCLTEKL